MCPAVFFVSFLFVVFYDIFFLPFLLSSEALFVVSFLSLLWLPFFLVKYLNVPPGFLWGFYNNSCVPLNISVCFPLCKDINVLFFIQFYDYHFNFWGDIVLFFSFCDAYFHLRGLPSLGEYLNPASAIFPCRCVIKSP